MNDFSWTSFVQRRFKDNLQNLENSTAEDELKTIFNPIIKAEKNPQHADFWSVAGRIRCLITSFVFIPTFLVEEGYLICKIGYNAYKCSLECFNPDSEVYNQRLTDLLRKTKLAVLLPFTYAVKIPMLAAGAIVHPRIVFATNSTDLPSYYSPEKQKYS